MACNRQPGSLQDVDPHGRPDGWTEGGQGRMTGRVSSGAASFGRLQGRLCIIVTLATSRNPYKKCWCSPNQLEARTLPRRNIWIIDIPSGMDILPFSLNHM